MSLYAVGFSDGLGAFAWWKDGAQHVGTMGKTLAEARARLPDCYGYDEPAAGDDDALAGYTIPELIDLIEAARRVAKAKCDALIETHGGCACHLNPPCSFCEQGGKLEIP